jgi:hypothetical protein
MEWVVVNFNLCLLLLLHETIFFYTFVRERGIKNSFSIFLNRFTYKFFFVMGNQQACYTPPRFPPPSNLRPLPTIIEDYSIDMLLDMNEELRNRDYILIAMIERRRMIYNELHNAVQHGNKYLKFTQATEEWEEQLKYERTEIWQDKIIESMSRQYTTNNITLPGLGAYDLGNIIATHRRKPPSSMGFEYGSDDEQYLEYWKEVLSVANEALTSDIHNMEQEIEILNRHFRSDIAEWERRKKK